MPIDQRVLERVRGLLAKAESSTFPHEAEALTSKAQELMARHSIDLAMVDRVGAAHDAIARTVRLDRPYVSAKAVLLGKVARANRCRSAWDPHTEVATIVGHEADVDATELLFTSLLVQASVAMAAEGSRVDHVGRSRTKSFRRSFLLAFAVRIGQRLAEASRRAEADGAVDYGEDLLPVLASRDAEVEQAFQKVFPHLERSRIAASNAHGWRAGTAAADRARLTPPGEIGQRRRSA